MASSLQVSIELLARIEEYLRVLFRKIEVVWCGIIWGGGQYQTSVVKREMNRHWALYCFLFYFYLNLNLKSAADESRKVK